VYEVDLEVAVILIGVTTLSISILLFTEPQNHLSDTTIATIAVIVTVAIFITERIIDRYLRDQENNERKLRSGKTILKEIANHGKAFNNLPHYKPEPAIDFVNAYLNTDAYDSLVSSGLFTYFDEITQDELADLYIRVRLHNNLFRYREQFADNFFLYSDSAARQAKWKMVVLGQLGKLHPQTTTVLTSKLCKCLSNTVL
jgi:hypothetical protein